MRTYGDDGELATVTDWNSNQTSFGYDQNGALQTTTSPNGVVGTNTYDNAGQLSSIGYVKTVTNLATFTYGRTNGGDINGETNSGSSAGTNKTYTYNTLGQLTTQNGGNFTYDAADNLKTTPSLTFTYDDANEVLTKTPTVELQRHTGTTCKATARLQQRAR